MNHTPDKTISIPHSDIISRVQDLNVFLARLDALSDALLRLESAENIDETEYREEKKALLIRERETLDELVSSGKTFLSAVSSARSDNLKTLQSLGVYSVYKENDVVRKNNSTEADESVKSLQNRLNIRLEFLKLRHFGRLNSEEIIRQKRVQMKAEARSAVSAFLDAVDSHSMGRHKVNGTHEEDELISAGELFERALQAYFDSCVTQKERQKAEHEMRTILFSSMDEHKPWKRAERKYDNYIQLCPHAAEQSEALLVQEIRDFLDRFEDSPKDIGDDALHAILEDVDKLSALYEMVCGEAQE